MEKTRFTTSFREGGGGRGESGRATARVQTEPFRDLGYTQDRHAAWHSRALRWCKTEKAPCNSGIIQALRSSGQCRVMATRVDRTKKADEVASLLSERDAAEFVYPRRCRDGRGGSAPDPDGDGYVVVAAAGTSDLCVSEEAASLTAEMMGSRLFVCTT